MRTPPPPSPRAAHAFTLVELLTVIAIIGILAGILIPVTSSVRARARVVACGSNLRQIALANIAYANENKGQFPPLPTQVKLNQGTYVIGSTPSGKGTWLYMGELVQYGYITDGKVFYCPTITSDTYRYETQWLPNVANGLPTKIFNIGYNQRALEPTDTHPAGSRLTLNSEATYVLIHDSLFTITAHPEAPQGNWGKTGPRGVNVAFSDGHVKYQVKDLPGRFWYHDLNESMYNYWEKNYR
ncbi:MAG: prepilin-type N-terminal cleavage/methylation domain-containing protein [Opitutaceae bacterium]|jgi:prepilin-type N-terminal cleavage/methylation domain-containing protein/prepilin-type processing-associated H-X9-DG protein|nr:prepilin-type N-terminal cleavage/methylation domain-containing protein [Opitutaceae bacterium]